MPDSMKTTTTRRYSFFLCCVGTLVLLNTVICSGDEDDDDDDDVDNNNRVYDYTYIQDVCNENKALALGSNSSKRYGFVMSSSNGCYDPFVDCRLQLNASLDHQITIRFQELATPCYEDSVFIMDTEDKRQYCGYVVPSYSLYSSSNFLEIRFRTGDSALTSSCSIGFKLYYTTYHTGECSDDEFRCSIDGRCIPDELVCDLYDNCGDWSDERIGTCGLSTGGLIAVIVISAVVGISCLTFIAYCIYDRTSGRKARRQQRRQQSNARSNHPPETAEDSFGQWPHDEPPPLYTYVNTVTAGVYEALDPDPDAPPPYHIVTASAAAATTPTTPIPL